MGRERGREGGVEKFSARGANNILLTVNSSKKGRKMRKSKAASLRVCPFTLKVHFRQTACPTVPSKNQKDCDSWFAASLNSFQTKIYKL